MPTTDPDPRAGVDPVALARVVERAESLLGRFEQLFGSAPAPDWDAAIAWRWRRRPTAFGVQAGLQPVRQVAPIRLDDLKHVDEQKRAIERNTRQFVQRRPANNVLLTGSRGTGKSSLIKALLNEYAPQGMRLIEVDKDDLVDL